MVLSLRARILLFLLFFALAPLFTAVMINLPLVLDRVETFYRHAFLENLRADFRDLDQHMASRDEMLRLLAKLPEPGAVIGTSAEVSDEQIILARASYTHWINHIFDSQLDIQQIIFLDADGIARFWLERDPEEHQWQPVSALPRLPSEQLIEGILKAQAPVVVPTPVRIDEEDGRQSLSLQMISPLGVSEGQKPTGAVVITIEIEGLVRSNPNTYWVLDSGAYLHVPEGVVATNSAFSDFPGLEQRFVAGKINLWEQDGQDIIWVPLLQTQDGRPLWVARAVNREPLDVMQEILISRVLSIVLVLAIITVLVARLFAKRAERFGSELLTGIRQMLEKDEAVTFNWRAPRELRQLGADLSVLAESHARNVHKLHAHTRELEESNRYKSEFLANVSHELRTPLNSILLLSKMLDEGNYAQCPEVAKRASVIHQASRDLRSLIDNILDLSRMEAGQHTAHIETVNLAQLLGDVLTLMQPQFEARGLFLRQAIDSGAPGQIHTDPDKLRQILKNFLANAVKFTHEGGATLYLRPATAPYVVEIGVRDTGIGIDAQKHQLIFEAFKQADGAINRRYGGTGLGLTISQRLAQLLGGTIRLESSHGEGACFSLWLPAQCGDEVSREVAAGPEQRLSTEATRELPEADFSGCHVVLMDNNMRNLLKLTQSLESWGASVTVVEDEEELSETLSEDPDCSMLLLAWNVFGPDSYATIERLKRQTQNRPLEVVLMTAEPDTLEGMAALQGPMVDPLELHELLASRLSKESGRMA